MSYYASATYSDPPRITVQDTSDGDPNHKDIDIGRDIYDRRSWQSRAPTMQHKQPPQSGFKNLATRLNHHGVRHKNHEVKCFWPYSLLSEILTPLRIREELIRPLYRFHHEDMPELIRNITAEYLRIFAILSLLEKAGDIVAFMKCEISDKQLPIFNMLEDGDRYFFPGSSFDTSQPVECLHVEDWRACDRDLFASYQHRVNPVILRMDKGSQCILQQELTKEHILPFKQEIHRWDGGFGFVSEVIVDPRCHEFQQVISVIKTNDTFALKQNWPSDSTESQKHRLEFDKEVTALKRFNGFFHDHLVTLLTAWSIGNNHFLLFPMARCNLDVYWSQHMPAPTLTLDMMRWMSKQVMGMSSALQKIHTPPATSLLPSSNSLFGRHGDLKPENILWYDSPKETEGIFIIADLGCTALNSVFSRSNVPNDNLPCTPMYKPPECELKGGKISRSFDIWTFGCVLLELTIWALEGNVGRQRFLSELEVLQPRGVRAPSFYEFKGTPQNSYVVAVNEKVSKCIADLHSLKHCTEYFHDLLDLIEQEMIVTLSATQNRIDSEKLLMEITKMHHKVETQGRKYAEQPCVRSHEAEYETPVIADLKPDVLRDARNVRLDIHDGNTQVAKTSQELSAMHDA